MKNILITGASGFVGSRLLQIAKDELPGDVNIILLTSKPIENYKCILYKGTYGFTRNDFINIGIERIDIVIHVGSFVPKTNDQKMDYALNHATIANTQYLLDHLPGKPEKFILCSSIGVYGTIANKSDVSKVIDEDTPIRMDEQYSLSKYCCELLVKEWANKNKVVCQILRLGSIYGIGDRQENFLVGTMLLKAIKGEKLILSADPETKRNLIYVDDLCRFILRSIQIEGRSEVINIVSERNLSFYEIMQAIVKAGGGTTQWEVKSPFSPARGFVFDAAKRVRLLGKEEMDFDQGVKQVFDWMKKNTR